LTPRILVVDDEANLRKTLSTILKQQGYQTKQAGEAKEALEIIRKEKIALIILDIKMPGMTGIELLKLIREEGYHTPAIFITAYGSLNSAVEALRLGAYDYITKPFNPENILHTINRALDYWRLKEENVYLRTELEKRYGFEELVGKSPSMRRVYSLIQKLAQSKVSVLIRGESGTGKELVAWAIHKRSPWKKEKFVTVNCGALPESLLESEIFGHEKGSFTGADSQKKGLFELADGGTIFLDEIGDLTLSVQMKLLRFLQSGEFNRVGGVNPIKVNVRTVSATNKPLEELMKEGDFREDLYYRVNAVSINLPPLRERKEDIPLLVEHFMKKYSREEKISPKKISSSILNTLYQYKWPGNVRELENLIRSALVLSEGKVIREEDFSPYIRKEVGKSELTSPPLEENHSLKDARGKVEKDYLLNILGKTDGNVSQASKLAGISRRYFYEKMKEYSIDPKKI